MDQKHPLPKQKLVETAAQLIYRQGWNATGINQILVQAKVPKGSFYYYFRSKEDLGAAIVDHYRDFSESVYRQTFLNESLTPREAIESYFKQKSEAMEKQLWRWGCPVGSFANEVADTAEEKIATACRDFLRRFEEVLETAIARAQREGVVSSGKTSSELAMQVSSVWQGSLLCMKTHQSSKHLSTGIKLINATLFAD
ncbi:MAG: TetR/AcrR family transcriptional regulator [Bdellovibrionota bacterium]